MIYLIFVCSIFIHEISHIITGSILGYRVKKFCFLPFGAYIEFKEREKINHQIIKNILVFLAGPISNFFISYFSFTYEIRFKEEIFYTNLILGIFNLFPIIPLDGSKILKEIFKIFFDNQKSNIYLYRFSKLVLCLFTFFYSLFIVKIKNLSLVIIIVYLWYVDYKEEKMLKTTIRAYKVIEKSHF